MELREALENALEGKLDDEARMLIKALLDQRVDNVNETLVDECQQAIFG